jgi:hypothetical protein
VDPDMRGLLVVTNAKWMAGREFQPATIMCCVQTMKAGDFAAKKPSDPTRSRIQAFFASSR